MEGVAQTRKLASTPVGRIGRGRILGLFAVVLALVSIWALASGPVETGTADVLRAISGSDQSVGDLASVAIRQIRMPRLVSGLLVGAALTLAGALLQGLFRNPLADPALIGVSSGAAMGGVLALVALPLVLGAAADAGWGLPPLLNATVRQLGLPLFAMGGAVGLTFVIYRVSLVRGRTHVPAMLLTGIAVNAIGGAFVGLLVTVFATDEQLRSVTFWTLGSLAGAGWGSTGIMALFIVPTGLLALRYGRALNSFLLGEGEAYHLGVDVQHVKRTVIVLSALMVGATVAFCGIIGFVGLVVPHMIRTLFGPNHRFLLPAGMLLGAIILIAADVFARTVVAPSELQIGILTSLLGGPFFLALLLRARRQGTSNIGL
ncbi:MAG: iron chelate uptake ABC transporter family permease subunit [Verrucomicrobia bacterium]|jgi:iron complex transport system permease protein|nr:iron chelate uptake ABC transporter family permease subunit [Verrucomicrobiota bacterium]